MNLKGCKRYVLGTLTLLSTVYNLDGIVMIIVLQSIKNDLQLSDTQLGFLTGLAFSLFYATLGLPIARWADRGNRVTIASFAIGVWGLTAMSCLLVTNYAQLIAARVAAGVGEAGCMPPTYSLIGDYFPAAGERARAMAVYWSSTSLAALLGFSMGGWLNAAYGWRASFAAIGVPGLVIALITKLTITEPRTRGTAVQADKRPSPPVRAVFRLLWRQPSARHLSIAVVLVWTLGGGLAPWYAAFMMRSHAMTSADLGVWLALIFGLSGVAGTILGGYAAERWFSANEPGQLRLSAMMIALLIPCLLVFLLASERRIALAALVPLALVNPVFVGPGYALMQRLVPDDMRATVLAIVMLFANLIGTGIGPQIVGIASDAIQHIAGVDSLRYAMILMSSVAMWAAWHFWVASRTVKADLAQVAHSGRDHAGDLALPSGGLQ